MEMGRIVIVVKHRYDNTEESTNLWHVSNHSIAKAILHPTNNQAERRAAFARPVDRLVA